MNTQLDYLLCDRQTSQRGSMCVAKQKLKIPRCVSTQYHIIHLLQELFSVELTARLLHLSISGEASWPPGRARKRAHFIYVISR